MQEEREGAPATAESTTGTPLERQDNHSPAEVNAGGGALAPINRRRGMESYEPRGMIIPLRLRIGQPGTSGITDGMFFNEVTGTEQSEIQVVFLTEQISRVLFKESGGYLCRSNDGQHPSSTTDGEIAESCAACPYSKWQQTDEGSKPPKCDEYWNFLAIDIATMKPLLLPVHGMSLTPADAFMQNVLLWDVDLFRVKVTLSLEMKQKGIYTYYRLRFSDVKQMTEDESAAFEEMYTDLVERGGIMAAAVDASATQGSSDADEESPF